MVLRAHEDHVAGIDAVAGHGVALGDEREVAGEVVLHADEVRAVARAVDRLAAGDRAENRHAPVPADGNGSGGDDGRLPGERGERDAELLRVVGDDRQARDALFRLIAADDLLGRAQPGSQLLLGEAALLAQLLQNVAEFHRRPPLVLFGFHYTIKVAKNNPFGSFFENLSPNG